jgi:uncharacterized protein with GYD domain
MSFGMLEITYPEIRHPVERLFRSRSNAIAHHYPWHLTLGVGIRSLRFTLFGSQAIPRILKGDIMATYISLVQFTDKGIQAAKETTQRLADWASKVESMGVSINQMYWTLGQYDQVCVFDAPDDETAASVLLGADMLGNIRTQTLRAFTASEMEKILAKMP